MKNNFTPFPNLESSRVMLRKLMPSDRLDIFRMRSNPKMCEHADMVVDECIEESDKYIAKINAGIEANKWCTWAIEIKDTQHIIGQISLWNLNVELNKGELGYGLNPKYWGQGLMKETIDLVVYYAFNVMKLSSLEIYTEKSNERSLKLASKCGFTYVREVEEDGSFKNELFHYSVFEIKNHHA